MKLTDIDQKNNLISDQLMAAIERVHGSMRPFIVIFPGVTEEEVASSITNILAVEFVKAILADYLCSLEGIEEMESITPAVVN